MRRSEQHLRPAYAVPVAEPALVELPATRSSQNNTLDPKKICRAVLDAAAATNAHIGSAFFPCIIRYVPNDSPDYAIYGICTGRLIRRIASGGAFESVPSVA